MNAVFIRIVNKGTEPTRGDIAELLASIGEPGEKRDQKQEAVQKLFDELGVRSTNFQGHSVVNYLDDFEAW